MGFKRADRVGDLIKEEVSMILQREVSDPALAMSTITGVKLSADLKHAKIYYICDASKQEETKAGFERSKGFIKKILASKINIKFMPDIIFYYDESFDYSSKIEGILREIKKQEDAK